MFNHCFKSLNLFKLQLLMFSWQSEREREWWRKYKRVLICPLLKIVVYHCWVTADAHWKCLYCRLFANLFWSWCDCDWACIEMKARKKKTKLNALAFHCKAGQSASQHETNNVTITFELSRWMNERVKWAGARVSALILTDFCSINHVHCKRALTASCRLCYIFLDQPSLTSNSCNIIIVSFFIHLASSSHRNPVRCNHLLFCMNCVCVCVLCAKVVNDKNESIWYTWMMRLHALRNVCLSLKFPIKCEATVPWRRTWDFGDNRVMLGKCMSICHTVTIINYEETLSPKDGQFIVSNSLPPPLSSRVLCQSHTAITLSFFSLSFHCLFVL